MTTGHQQIALVEEWDEVTTVPYLTVPWAHLAELERTEGAAETRPTVCIDLPFAWPTALADQATVLPAAELATLVPEEAR